MYQQMKKIRQGWKYKIKKSYGICIAVFSLSFLVFLFFFSVSIEAEAASPGYTIEDYHMNMVVREENAYEITETITAHFQTPRHGIFRKLPLSNVIVRNGRIASANRAKITGLSVSEEFTSSKKGGFQVIKIGNPDATVTGTHIYTIKYTYHIGKDPLKGEDELYFNLIGDRWDTIIQKAAFTIEMPKKFDKSLLSFFCGSIGEQSDSHVSYQVEGNTINGVLQEPLNEEQALTIRLTLPEGYFTGADYYIDAYSVLVCLFSFACILIAAGIWMKYGNKRKTPKTVEYYPPAKINPAEAQLLLTGKANVEGIISLLPYLAEKGFLKIEETGEKGFLKKKKEFQITKIKEYEGHNPYERLVFENLFYWPGVPLNNRVVTSTQLQDNFLVTLGIIQEKLNSKESKSRIFDKSAIRKKRWLIGLMTAIYILITAKPALEYYEAAAVPVAVASIGFGFAFMIGTFIKSIRMSPIFGLIFGGGHSAICWMFILFPVLSKDAVYMALYVIGIACILAIVPFAGNMPVRTPYGSEMLRKLQGFQRFIKTAESSRMESLAEENPEYFYQILPYVYGLGLSHIWKRRFGTIALKAPDWYAGVGSPDKHDFHYVMTHVMPGVHSTMYSGGGRGAHGGGGAGGGSGGGGGGAW